MTANDSRDSAPIRIQLSRKKGWRMPEGAIRVDRSGPFGNPFPVIKATSTRMGVTKDTWVIGTWEGPAMWFRDTKVEAVELSVRAFRAWLETPGNSALRDKAHVFLRGHDLACWCALPKPGEPDLCHAAVLLELANA